jgi:HUS1 checkpoint protein
VFESFSVESAEDNRINIEVSIASLIKALKSSSAATDVTMRLSIRDTKPLLSFNICVPTSDTSCSNITHNIHIRVLSAKYAASIREPACPDPDVQILLPASSTLRVICDRYRTLSGRLSLKANMDGCLSLRVENDDVQIESSWKGLVNPILERYSQEAEPRPKDLFAGVRLSTRDFCNVIKTYTVAKRAIACKDLLVPANTGICDDLALIVYVYLTEPGETPEAMVTYYCPSYCEN